MKKLLITMLIALTMCLLLAFSVSAEEYELVDNLGDPSWYTGNYQLMTDKTSKVVLSNGDDTYTAYPAYYILKYNISVSNGEVTAAYISDLDYSFINDKRGTSYEYGALYKIEIPNGITRIVADVFGDHNGHKEQNLTELVMSNTVLSTDSHCFRKAANLKKVVLSKNFVDMNEYTFQDSAIEQVVFPAGSDAELDMSGNEIFRGCANLKSTDLTGRNIKKLGTKCFMNCTSLGSVALPDTIEEFGAQCFYECTNMYFASDFLPTSLKSVGFHFMTGAKHSNSVLFFPEGFTELSTTHAFAEGRYYNENGLTLVFLGKMTNINLGQYRQTSSGKLKIVLTKNDYADLNGKMVTLLETDGKLGFISQSGSAITEKTDGTLTIEMCDSYFPASNGKWKTENGITYNYVNTAAYEIYFCNGDDVELCYGLRSDNIDGKLQKGFTPPVKYDIKTHMDAGVHYDLTEVLSHANCGIDGVTENTCVLCDRVAEDRIPATGNHIAYEISPCADKCEVCLLYVQKATQAHVYFEYFTYDDGYMCKGAYGEKCENEGCSYVTVEVKEELIKDLGYSIPEFEGVRGINYGYAANKSVFGEFERVNKCKVELGFLVAIGENFAKDEKIFEVKFAKILDTVDVIVNYGERTDIDDCEIVMAASLILTSGDDVQKIYLQGHTEKTTTNYTSATYGTLYGISYSSLSAK